MACIACFVCLVSTVSGCRKNALGKGSASSGHNKTWAIYFSLDIYEKNRTTPIWYMWIETKVDNREGEPNAVQCWKQLCDVTERCARLRTKNHQCFDWDNIYRLLPFFLLQSYLCGNFWGENKLTIRLLN